MDIKPIIPIAPFSPVRKIDQREEPGRKDREKPEDKPADADGEQRPSGIDAYA